MNDSPKTLHGSNGWLRNSFHVHLSVTKQEDGSFLAESQTGQKASGPTETDAVRNLKQQFLSEGLKGRV